MISICSASPGETRDLASRLASLLQGGDVLVLQGDLGAGKSEFTRGLAKGLGISGPIPSPSFTILNVYEDGRLPLYHYDFYRLESSEELYEMGLEEYLEMQGVSVIEWPEKCPDAIPSCHLLIRIRHQEGDRREIHVSEQGGFHPVSTLLSHDQERRLP